VSSRAPEPSGKRSGLGVTRFWRSLSVTRRFSIVLALVVAGTALIQGVVLFQIASNGFIALERERLTYRIRDAGKIIEANFEAAASNVQALAETPPIQGLIETINHGGYYRKSSTRDWQARLSIIFTGFLKANPAYSQLRYIAKVDDGRELVRVERVGSEILVRQGAELQRKGDRDYFEDTMTLSPGSVYISDIDLNREFGEIVTPFEPTVRIAVPVFDGAGEFFGIVVLNVDFLAWSDALSDAVVKTDRIYLTDDMGNYLIHPDPTMPFAWELGTQAKLWEDRPQFAELFAEDHADEVETLSGEDVLFGYRLHFDPQNLDRALVLAASSSRNVLLASTYEMGRWSIVISIFMVVLAVVLAQWMARPFVQLMTAARRVIDGYQLEQRTSGQSGTVNVELIADAFQVMETAVQEREAELRETEATTHAILDSAANPVISINAAGHIDRVNRSTQSTFGYSDAELLGQHISIILKAAESWGSRDIPVGSQANVDLEATCKDGTQIPTLVTIAEVSLENTTLYTIAIVDLRELRKAEKAKNEFVSVVSHELRTPLTSIRGALGLLQGPLRGELTPKVYELTTIAHKNSERLINIINDILDIEKLESGKVQVRIEPLEANAALRQAIESNTPYGDRYGVAFVLQEIVGDPTFLADPGRFQQVMSNLMSNAAKFSDGSPTVEIGGRSSGRTLHLTVRDHGAGMTDEFKEQAFGKFMQGEASLERRHEGTGLGLAITRMLVRAMGGDVTFQSELGKGTCFEVSLPLAQETGLPASGNAARKGPDVRTRVLICEDDTDTRTVLETWIRNDGRMVADSVATLAQAREAIGKKEYAVVVLDLTLPDGDGSELIREIHGNEKALTKVVVVTGMADRNKGELDDDAMPVADWLLKPVGQYQLMESIRLAQVPANADMPRILHVEDDPDMASVIASALEGSAIVVAAPTLALSRERLAREPFDMIVLDLDLPDGPGRELLDTIAELKITTPVIILSASEVDDETRRRTLANVVKSRISDSALVDMIKAHLKKHTAT